MCFSATASFSAGAFLLGLGALTLKSARRPRELPFAAIPLLFAIQQLSEGVIWLTFSYEAPLLNMVMTHVYSFFSHVLWPIYVPVAVLLIEPPGRRWRAILVFVAAGFAVGLYLLYFLIANPIVSRPIGQHIEYLSPHFFSVAAITLYLMSTTLTPLLSTHRTVKVFGGLALSSFAAAYFFYATWFISVWCFFAALLSAVVYLHFLLRKTDRSGPLGTTAFGRSSEDRFSDHQLTTSGARDQRIRNENFRFPRSAPSSKDRAAAANALATRIALPQGGIMIGRAASGVPPRTMAVLMLSVFTVSMGYGIVLPLLPFLIERLGTGGDAAQVARSTGLLTGLYTLSIFLFAPVWGRISDWYGRRTVLLIGLIGFGATMLTFAFIETVPAVYAERFLSGMFAAAVTPVAMAAIGDLAATEEARARRLTFVSLAGISGFLLGPMLGVFIARAAATLFPIVSAAGSLAIPLAAAAILALLVAVAAAMTVAGTKRGDAAPRRDQTASEAAVWLIPKLLSLAFIVSAGVGVFEVGLALRGKQELGLTQYQIALMFTECSLVMFVAQAVVFSPLEKPETTRWLIAPGFAVLAAGLFLVPHATDFMLMLAVIGAVAGSAGILSPILTYWISSKAGKAQERSSASKRPQQAWARPWAQYPGAAFRCWTVARRFVPAGRLADRAGCSAQSRPPEAARVSETRGSRQRPAEISDHSRNRPAQLTSIGWLKDFRHTRKQSRALLETLIMKPESKSWDSSSIALSMAGVTLIGVGLYFIFLRPPLLPEDVRYIALQAAQFDIVKPRLEAWLTHVFRVMGGYVLATGVLTITLAATSFRAHQQGTAIGVLIGGAASIGWMAAVNFVIDSDFKWVLLGMALLWACSLVLFWLEKSGALGRGLINAEPKPD